MIDAAQTVDTVKLRFYIDWLYQNHVYDEGDSGYHKTLTDQVVKQFIDPLNLPKDAHILDMGCGVGYFLDAMKERGYTNTIGVTLSVNDIKECERKGHVAKQYDISFLPQIDGYHDESVDFIFLRQSLEHSPFPIITLMEYNRVLRQHSKLYIEVPAPDCARKHEFNPNHYSILGETQLVALLIRTGFDVDSLNYLEYEVNEPNSEVMIKEKAYVIMATKKRPLDIK